MSEEPVSVGYWGSRGTRAGEAKASEEGARYCMIREAMISLLEVQDDHIGLDASPYWSRARDVV
jgi:hypothetical protein